MSETEDQKERNHYDHRTCTWNHTPSESQYPVLDLRNEMLFIRIWTRSESLSEVMKHYHSESIKKVRARRGKINRTITKLNSNRAEDAQIPLLKSKPALPISMTGLISTEDGDSLFEMLRKQK